MDYWQRMPPRLIEKRILVPGGAFRMKYQFEADEEKRRYFFILKDPVQSTHLFMLTATTNIHLFRKLFRHDKDALVIIKKREYRSLECTSLVDCGSPVIELKENIVNKITNYEIQPLPQLPDFILHRLRNAVAYSKRLTSNQKRLVLGEEECGM